MISPSAVRAFLHRQVDDFAWIKDVPRAELLRIIPSCIPRERLEPLRTHQLAMLAIGIAYPQFAFWAGMGVGKTLLALILMEYWDQIGTIKKALVCVPSLEAAISWEDEMRLWKFRLPFQALVEETAKDKLRRFIDRKEGVLVVPYPSLNHMASERRPAFKRGLPTGKTELVPQKVLVDALCKGLGCVVWDESTELKNHRSLQFEIARAIGHRVNIRYALAGRPLGKDPMDLWAQQFLVDQGESLGRTLGMYREAFFEKKNKYWGGPYAFEYTFRKKLTDDLHRLSGHRSIRYSSEECIDLPPLTRIIKRVPFPEENLAYYKRTVAHLIESKGDRMAAFNDFCKMRQLSSGFLGVKADGAKIEVEFDKVPKLDLMVEMLKQLPEGGKAVIFMEFINSGKIITKRLRKEKVQHVHIWSGTKDRRAALERFLRDPSCEVLVLNHQIGAYALNLQVAHWVFFYESPLSSIDRDQAERRCYRQGQKHRVFLVDLITDGSIDGGILDSHKEGGDLFKAIMRDPTTALRTGPAKSRVST